jgi:hypothetical protein
MMYDENTSRHRWHLTSGVKHFKRMRGAFGSAGDLSSAPTPTLELIATRTPPPGGGLFYFLDSLPGKRQRMEMPKGENHPHRPVRILK